MTRRWTSWQGCKEGHLYRDIKKRDLHNQEDVPMIPGPGLVSHPHVQSWGLKNTVWGTRETPVTQKDGTNRKKIFHASLKGSTKYPMTLKGKFDEISWAPIMSNREEMGPRYPMKKFHYYKHWTSNEIFASSIFSSIDQSERCGEDIFCPGRKKITIHFHFLHYYICHLIHISKPVFGVQNHPPHFFMIQHWFLGGEHKAE